jgi:NAD(P)-dependent dehydrogenase (short-subunit alcohol dehydrogenase family)
MSKMGYCIIVGSSRGLGAALVEEFLARSSIKIIGIARTKAEQIRNYDKWISSGRYRHIEMDIASPQCREVLRDISMILSPDPVCIIFNAAHVKKDLNKDQTINFDTFDNVNRVGIDGLGNILYAFEGHLLRHGGLLVGISSFWGSVPPLFLPWVAYPASKAYLNMTLRCLRVAWREHVKVVVVNIGNIETPEKSHMPKWFVPSYKMTAKKIVGSVLRRKIPREINYPLWHTLFYKYIMRFVPEFLYSWIFNLYLKLESSRKK